MTTIKAKIPVTWNIKHKRGSDFHRTIKLRESDSITVKTTTDYSSTLTIKNGQNGEVYKVITATNSPSSGQFNYDCTAADLDTLDFSSAEYEIQIVDNNGGKTIPFVGSFSLF